METELVKLLAVFGLGTIELWTAIPAGFVMGLHPLLIGMISAAGATSSVMFILFLGEKIRNRLVPSGSDQVEKKHGRIYRIWERYGAPGMGLLSPLITGAPLGAALGVALGVQKGRLLFWMTGGIILWTSILTIIGMLGLAGIEALLYNK
jgi:hypothetical protein